MSRFDAVSFADFILMLAIRIVLYVVRTFVLIGEVVSICITFPIQFVYGHLRVLFYFVKHIGGKAYGSLRVIPNCIRLVATSASSRIQILSAKIAQSAMKLRRAKRLTTSEIAIFRSTASWETSTFKHQNKISHVIHAISALIHRISTESKKHILSSISLLFLPFKRLQRWTRSIHFRVPLRKVSQQRDSIPRISYTSFADRQHKVRRKYRNLKLGIVGMLMFVFASGTFSVYTFYTSLPRPQDIGRINFALSTHVYDRSGKTLFDFYKDEQRTPVRLSDLPHYVAEATIAIEDKDFYRHNGISLVSGIARAFRDTFFRNQGVQGGSTITQQLVKTALLSPERTLLRKFKEAIIALETERIFSKDEILEMYLNQVPYGGSVYGIEEASLKFFGKDVKEITLSEAALLAGLPQAPTSYSPFTNLSAAKARRDQVLRAMLDQSYITSDEYDLATQENVNVALDKITIKAPHFVFYVRQQLEHYLDTNDLYQGGYRVYTTLDLDIQEKAQTILKEELDKVKGLNVSNGAIMVVDPSNGDILAMVGSVDYFDGKSGEYNVTTALRQPGSSIKPILYSYALERGFTAATIIDDSSTVFQTGGYESYRPVNYDGTFHGKVTIRNALANSYNIPAVKVMNRIGVEDFISYANHLGIETWQDPSNYGLSIALGGGDVTMIDMARAYGVLASGGLRREIVSISQIVDKRGRLLKQEENSPEQVIDPAYAYIISDIISDNQARTQAFGNGSLLEIPGYRVAVKTGTTDEKRDNWTIGYTPNYLVLVWVGNNDHSPMNPYLTSGVTGAAPIWNRMMKYVLEERSGGEKQWYTKPDNIIQKNCMAKMESFVAGTESSVPCAMPKPDSKSVADTYSSDNR